MRQWAVEHSTSLRLRTATPYSAGKSPKELGVRKDQVWAFREGVRKPLKRVRIVNPLEHYDAPITIQFLDAPLRERLTVRRSKLPCIWSEVDCYRESHPDLAADDRDRN